MTCKQYLCLSCLIIIAVSGFSQTGPGGVGSNDGASNLVLWLDADTETAISGTTPTTWNDRSGYGNHFNAGTGATFRSAARNGHSFFEFFDSGSRFFQRAYTAALNPTTFSIFSATNVTSSFSSKTVISSLDISAGVSGFMLNSSSSNNYWQLQTGASGTGLDNLDTGISTAGNWAGQAMENADVTNGKKAFVNGTQYGPSTTFTMTPNTSYPTRIGARENGGTPNQFFNGDIGEIIMFNTVVNEAQRIIIDNYLAAKYDYALTSNDVYDEDTSGGDFDFDVAGIGRIDASNLHDDAQGTGIIRILNPTDLGDDEFLMWGHDNEGLAATNSTDIPSSLTVARMNRVWRVSEANTSGGAIDVGALDLRVDLTGVAGFSTSNPPQLLVDENDNGIFSDETTTITATPLGDDLYEFTGITTLANNRRFTLANALFAFSQTGPGGVGTDDGTSNLVLWLEADIETEIATSGSTLTIWHDRSGYENHFNAGNGAIFQSTARNGYSTFNFNGTYQYFERAYSAALNPTTFSVFSATNITAGFGNNTVISNMDDPAGTPTAGFILYSQSSSWRLQTGSATANWDVLDTGISTGGNWAGQTMENANVANGKKAFVNSTQSGPSVTYTMTPNTVNPIRVGASQNTGSAANFFRGDIGEIIMFNTVLNDAQRIIIDNYLAAKYDYTLTSNDLYDEDTSGGDFDHEVAGIGRVDASNIHDNAQGTGVIRILNPTDLGDDEFLIWGHDNRALTATNTSDIPSSILAARLDRVWSVSEANTSGGAVDVGAVDLQVDLDGVAGFSDSNPPLLLVDQDDDGIFADETTFLTATPLGGDIYEFTGATALVNNRRFTFANANATFSQTGPGGVGTDDGTSNLVLWLEADTETGTSGSTSNSWSDRSGYGHHFTEGNWPAFQYKNRNGYSTFDFNGNFQYFRRAYTAALNPSAFSIFSANNITSSTKYKTVISSLEDPTGTSNSRGFMLYSLWHTNIWEFWTGSPIVGWDKLNTGISTQGNWAGQTMESANVTNGKKAFVNGTQYGSSTTFTMTPNTSYPTRIGARENGSTRTDFFMGEIGEILMFNTVVNDAQRIIIDNYLAAKYDYTLTSNDLYDEDTSGGDFDHDVAGIGRVDALNIHNDSQGTGVIRILNPTDLGDDEFLIWGHSIGTLLTTNTTDVPSSLTVARMNRVWRVSEANTSGGTVDVGALDLRIDLTGVVGFNSTNPPQLLVDENDNGIFSDETTIITGTSLGGSLYEFTGITALANNRRFTFANAIAASLNTGPGGVGTNDGNSNLVLWLEADSETATSGSTVTVWNDISGYDHHFVEGNGATFQSAARNGYSTFNFDGTSHYFERANTAALSPTTFSLFSANNVTSTIGVTKSVISNLDFPVGTPATGFQLSTYFSNEYWQFLTGSSTASWNFLDSGVATAGNWAGVSLENANVANGKKAFVNSTQSGPSITHTMTPNTVNPIRVGASNNSGNTTDRFRGEMGELIIFNNVINDAQRIIIDNYLAAKYDYALTSNDLYDEDTSGGDFDHDVAGIGRVDASNIHDNARGTGVVRIFNPTDLGDDEFLIWGHDNGSLVASNTTDISPFTGVRLDRVWRASEASISGAAIDVGEVDLRIDLNGVTGFSTNDPLQLLVDENDNGIFSDDTIIITPIHLGGDLYEFTGVTALANNKRFTFGSAASDFSQTGPGGVGATNGASNLVLWLDANSETATSGSTVTVWNDRSGFDHHMTVGNGAIFQSAARNGYSTFNFDGTSHYFERPYTSALNPDAFSIFSAANVASTGTYKALLSNRDDPAGTATAGFILYSRPTTDYWEFWTGRSSGSWERINSTISTVGTWAGQSARYNSGANGKSLHVNSTLVGPNTHLYTLNPNRPLRVGAGQNETTPGFYFQGDMGDVILYNTMVNDAQRIIIENYLAAKYDYTLTTNDLFDEDTSGGDFDHDVAGIGRVDASNIHNDAQGPGIVRILNPNDLGDDEFLIWGHDNGALIANNTSDTPLSVTSARFDRIWRVSEATTSGGAINVGTVDLRVDMNGVAGFSSSNLPQLLVDENDNGIFSDETPIATTTYLGGDLYEFVGVSALVNNRRFTFAAPPVIPKFVVTNRRITFRVNQ